MIPRVTIHAALDTLENLRKGGRIGAAAALLGSMLSFKPIISVEGGKVEPAGRQRTRSKALNFLVEQVAAEAEQIERLAIIHAQSDDIDAFAQRLREVTDVEPMVCLLGPVVGAHAGPRTTGVITVRRAAG